MNRKFCASILLLCLACFSVELAARTARQPKTPVPPEKRPAEQV